MGDYVRNYHFEHGVPKLQLGQNLSRIEKEAVQIFHVDDEPAEPAHFSYELDIEAILAGATRQAAASRSRYNLLSMCLPRETCANRCSVYANIL